MTRAARRSLGLTFYSRVYEMRHEVYAPTLAPIAPIEGLLGGIDSGLAGDRLSKCSGRAWLNANVCYAKHARLRFC